MERLEAALEKARKSRAAAQQATAGSAGVSVPKTEPAEAWAKLKEIKISARVARNHRITTIAPGKGAGAYDLLRSRALRLMLDKNWSSLAITSPNQACGKTTVAANLALSLARQPELRIMLIDLDLRRPAMQKIIGHRPAKSFHEVLEGKVRAEDQLVRVGDNLAIGLNNSQARSPSELLQSSMTKRKLAQIREVYAPDLVIYDMPPMLVSDDNVGFLPLVDCGLLVSAADSTTVAQLDACEKELSELTNVLGVVLNKCKYTDDDSGYDYEYY